MRQIVLDTETTGLEAHLGHRLVEIGAVEMIGRRPTGSHFHTYLNPQRAIDEEASKVTGIKDEDLVDKPLFIDKVDEFLDFTRQVAGKLDFGIYAMCVDRLFASDRISIQ